MTNKTEPKTEGGKEKKKVTYILDKGGGKTTNWLRRIVYGRRDSRRTDLFFRERNINDTGIPPEDREQIWVLCQKKRIERHINELERFCGLEGEK